MAPVKIKDETKVKNEFEDIINLKTKDESQRRAEFKIKLNMKTKKPEELPGEAVSTAQVPSDTSSDNVPALPEMVCSRPLEYKLVLMEFINKENEEGISLRVTVNEKRVIHSVSFAKRLRNLVEKHVTTFPECKEWMEQ